LSSPAEKSFRTDLASIIENIDQDEGCFLVEDPSNELKCLQQDVPKFDCVVFQPNLEGDAAITCKELEEEEPTHHPHQPTHHPHQPTHHPHQQCDIPIAHLPLIDQCDNSTTNLAPVQDVRRHSVSPDGRILAKLTSKLHLKMSPWHHADKTTDSLLVDNKDSTHRRFSQGNNFLHQIQKSLKGPTTPIPSDSQPDSSTNPIGSQSGDNAKNSDSKFQKMKQNLKNASKCYKESSSLSQDSGDLSMSSPRRKSCEFEMIDISSDDLLASPCVYKITYADYLLFGMSKC
jgi:hypothetical protein